MSIDLHLLPWVSKAGIETRYRAIQVRSKYRPIHILGAIWYLIPYSYQCSIPDKWCYTGPTLLTTLNCRLYRAPRSFFRIALLLPLPGLLLLLLPLLFGKLVVQTLVSGLDQDVFTHAKVILQHRRQVMRGAQLETFCPPAALANAWRTLRLLCPSLQRRRRRQQQKNSPTNKP